MFYAINVYNHGAWEEPSIIESLHRNWPDVIGKYRLHGIPGEQLKGTERRNIRKYNGHAAVATQDGTVYGAIGGGVSAVGTSGEAVMRADQWTYYIRRIQAGLEAKLNDLIPTLARIFGRARSRR
jgi:hypothetical protein